MARVYFSNIMRPVLGGNLLNLITCTSWPAWPRTTKGDFTFASRLKFSLKSNNYNKGQAPQLAEVRPHSCRHVRWPEGEPQLAAWGAPVFSGGQERWPRGRAYRSRGWLLTWWWWGNAKGPQLPVAHQNGRLSCVSQPNVSSRAEGKNMPP